MKDKIIDYTIAVGGEIVILKLRVLEHMKEGWQPFGSMTETDRFLAQPMVKYKEPKEKSVAPDINSELKERIGKILHRKPASKWSRNELLKLRSLGEIPEDDMALMERYYTFMIKPEEDYRRRSLEVLLNNWHGELDRANYFFKKQQKKDNAL